MIKRINKATALLVAVTSVMSSVSPAMAKDRLDAIEGSITNAIAFKDGKYLYEGNKGQNNTGLYYNDGAGKNEKLLDDVDEIDSNPEFGSDSVSVLYGNDKYKVNLSDGTVSNEDTKNDLEIDAESKLKSKLRKATRYGSDTEIKSFNRILDGQFGDNWYEYTATGNLAKYDDILRVPKKIAAGLTFTDEDATAGKISGTLSITKAKDEQDIDSYRVYYLDENDLKVGNAIGTVNKTESPLQVAIADTNIPSGATQFGVYSVNSKGESETSTKITIVDAGAVVKKYKAQVKIEITAFYADVVIEGKAFSPSWGSNLPDSLVQAVKDTKFDKYTVISAVSEHAFNEDGSIANNNGKATITLGTDEIVSSLPANFVTFNGDPNSGALKVQLISDYAVPDKLVNGITFTDKDTAANKISGTVSITKAADESNIDSYRVYYLNDNSEKVGDAIGTLNKGTNPLQVEIADTDIPAGATQLGVYSVNAHGESVKSTKTPLIDTKNDTSVKSKIKIEATAFWSDIVITGKTFSPAWGNNLPDALANAVKNTTFDNYTVISAVSEHAFNADGSVDNNNGKVTITLGSNEELSSLPIGFSSFNGDPNSSALNVSLISDYAVPDKLANGIKFTDKDTAANKISGTVSITKAADESNIDSYRVYYLNDNGEKVGDAIGTLNKGTNPLQVEIADTDIPAGAIQLGVYSVNAYGESVKSTKTPLIDTKNDSSIKSKIKIEATAFWSDIVIAGKTFSPSWGNNLPDALSNAVKNTTFDNYTVISAVSEHAFNADGSVDNNNGKVTITLGSNKELSSVPTGFANFTGDPNSSVLNVSLISDYAVPDKLANGITFTDEDTAANKISGTVSITKASDESNIDSYRVYYLNNNDEKIGNAIGTVDKGTSPLQVEIADTDISAGATQLGVYSVNAYVESINYTKTSLIDAVPANTTTGAAVSIEAKAKVTLTITGFYGNISIAGVTFSPAWGQDIMSTLASQIQDKNSQFTGYTLESATEEGGAVVAVFTTTESLLESNEAPAGFTTGLTDYKGGGAAFKVEPITIDTIITTDTTTSAAVSVDLGTRATTSTTTSAAVSVDLGTSATASTTTNAAVSVDAGTSATTSTTTSTVVSVNASTTTGAAVSVNTTAAGIVSTDNALKVISKNLTLGVYYAGATSSDTSSENVTYFGYTDGNGNYIDCSKMANISIFDGTDVVRIKNFNDEESRNGKTVKLGLPTLVKTIGQDKDYIYNVISVPVIGYQLVNGIQYKDNSKVIVYYVQKISKARGEKEDGGYLPRTVESYQLSNDVGWKGGDNWSYMAAYNALMLDDSSRKIKIINGVIYVAYTDTKEKKVFVANLHLKSKGITDVDEAKSKVRVPIVTEDTSHNTEIGTWTMDNNGGVWALYHGVIKKSAEGNDFKDMYRVDGTIDKLDVYDDDNLIGWSSSDDIYTTVKEGKALPDPNFKTELTVKVTNLWGDISIAGVKFSPKWGSDLMASLASDMKAASFSGSKLKSVTADEKTVTAVFITLGKLSSAPLSFTKGLDWTCGYAEVSVGEVSENNGELSINIVTEAAKADTGWKKLDDGTWHLYDASGQEVKGWTEVESKWYYMNDKGIMQTGWLNDKGKWYYLGDSGARQTGWLNDNDKWYYLDEAGVRQENTIIDGYYLDSNGVWIKYLTNV